MSSNPTPDVPPADELAAKLERTEIQHKQSSIAGREIVQVLTEIPSDSSQAVRTARLPASCDRRWLGGASEVRTAAARLPLYDSKQCESKGS
jgi:hypothetical protein